MFALPKRKPRGLLRADALVRMFLSGRDMAELAETYGIPRETVEHVIREANRGAKWWRGA